MPLARVKVCLKAYHMLHREGLESGFHRCVAQKVTPEARSSGLFGPYTNRRKLPSRLQAAASIRYRAQLIRVHRIQAFRKRARNFRRPLDCAEKLTAGEQPLLRASINDGSPVSGVIVTLGSESIPAA